jgi:hypothetical protein
MSFPRSVLRPSKNFRQLALRCLALAHLVLFGLTITALAQTDKDHDPLGVYNQAIYDSAVYKFSNLRPLVPLKFDAPAKTAKVVTLTSYGGYQPGEVTLTREVWVTGFPEVQNACRVFKGDLEMNLRELLGLTPTTTFTYFVTFEVREADVFRPTANPDPTTTLPCAYPVPATCGETFPDGVPAEHVKWFANKMLSSYVITESALIPSGYPWTRLGYTYNWRPGSNKYGASEYVIRPGSNIRVTEIAPYKTYCAPAN